MLTFMFPGQGAQYRGMGKDLFESSELFKAHQKEIDEIVGFALRETCLNGPDSRLRQTEITQPCIYVVNALYLDKEYRSGRNACFLIGHSLGEYNALQASGTFDFITGLKLVTERGRLMSQAKNGTMAAVMGLEVEKIREVLEQPDCHDVDLANLNTPEQTIISGPNDAIAIASAKLEKAGAGNVVPLPVGGAFHSRYMSAAAAEFDKFLSQFEFTAPSTTVIANATGQAYSSTASSDEIRDLLVRQIASPVRWSESVALLKRQGVKDFEEIGPSTILSRMIPQIPESLEQVLPAEAPKENIGSLNHVDLPANMLKPIPEIYKEHIQPGNNQTQFTLGSRAFMEDHHVNYPCVAGSMYRAIASPALVVAMSRAGFLSFFGAGGLSLEAVEAGIDMIQKNVGSTGVFGVNLLHAPEHPEKELAVVELLLNKAVKRIEASSYMGITQALIIYRLAGARRMPDNSVVSDNMILAKVSHPEVAKAFLRPAPPNMVRALKQANKITAEQAQLAESLVMADDICVESDSGGHTDSGVALTRLPAILSQREQVASTFPQAHRVRIGAGGGIGTPGAAAACFLMGADFIMTGSINQCTVEAGTSDQVKDILQSLNVQDTALAPAGDMFELGAKVQVARKGLVFHVRSEKLYQCFMNHQSWDEVDEATQRNIEQKILQKPFEELLAETSERKRKRLPAGSTLPPQSPKQQMVQVFKSYFAETSQNALNGADVRKIDYQIHCGPAMGSFNQWVKNTPLEDWRSRYVADINYKLIQETQALINGFVLSTSNSQLNVAATTA